MATEKQRITAAAKIYGCKVSELMSHKFYANGDVVIIAPNGMKFIYSEDLINSMIPKPRRRVPAKPKAKKNPGKLH
jgi:hypothetical protein